MEALLLWDDGYTQTVKYPNNIKGVKHNGKRFSSIKFDVKTNNILEWADNLNKGLSCGNR